MTDVFFALTGDPRRNSRALRQLRTLRSVGFGVHTLGFGSDAEADAFPGALNILPPPDGRGPQFFWHVHRQTAAHTVPARVYHASDLYVLPALAAAARRRGSRLVFDARELYPHVAATRGRPWASFFWHLLQDRYVRRADAVFTVSRPIARHLARSHGIPEPTLLHNVPPHDAVAPSPFLRDALDLGPDVVLVLHQGQMRPDRGCEALVDAVGDVPGAVLVFLGDGPLRPILQDRAQRSGVAGRVHFLPPVPPDQLLPVTAGADLGVTLLEDTCLNHRYALPNKLFEYLAAGVPVLGSDLPAVRDVVLTHDVGRVARSDDRDALVSTLREMVLDAPARARWARNAPNVFRTYDAASELGRFARIYRGLFSD